MIEDIKKRILEKGNNIYFLCEGDRNNNIRKEIINPANPNCNCYSVAKAFTVTAIGLLYDKGLIKLDMKVVDILKKYVPIDICDKWKKVTIHNLLLHQVGFDKGLLDIDCDDASKYETLDYLTKVFKTKLVYEPGTITQYTDAAYYVLSRVVCEISGMDIEDLLRPILMDKLHFKELAWSKCPYGYSIGATGIYIRTEDMVKLGILYVNYGKYNNEVIISKEWVNIVLENGYEFKHLKDDWYAKGGMCGQLLMFNMKSGKVIGCHSYDDNVSASLFIN